MLTFSLHAGYSMNTYVIMRSHLSVTKLHHALTEAHDDNFCIPLYTSKPKMSVYQSAFGYSRDFLAIFRQENSQFWTILDMTPFLCGS